MIDSQKTLWFNSDRTRFFLIPDNRQLSSGNFILYRGISYQISIDPNVIKPFEITREQAKAWLDSQWDEIINEAKQSASELFKQWSTPSTEPPTSFDAETKEKLADGIKELAKALTQRLRRLD